MAGAERQIRRPLLGALLIAALLGGAILIFFMQDLIGLFTPKYDVVAVVPQAVGIVDGSAVWVGGKEVGTVTRVAFMPSSMDTVSRVALTLELPRRLQPQVRRDSRVRFTSARLIGARVVDIIPGTAAAAELAPGDTLFQEEQITAAELTARAAAVKADLDTVLIGVRALAGPARQKLEETRRAMSGVEQAMAEARVLRSDLAANPGLELLRDPAFARSLASARRHAGELPVVIARLREQSEAAGEAAAALQRLQARADSLSIRLDAAAAALGGPNSSFARLRHDSALARALRGARTELDSLLAEVRRNPLRFVF
jgi:ABC-type transporter Mla subunit MlaD